MGYSNFKNLKQTLKVLQLEEVDINLFPNISTVEPTDWLQRSLAIAKMLEGSDAAVFELTQQWMSGHTLKHIAASLAALPVLVALRRA